MTIAGKHLDPLVGVDIHIILIPTPAGPVPTPLPHPYVGMVMDPFDYLPKIGATVLVNGLPRAQAGTSGLAVPVHIPMGGPFAKPPTNESEMFMGSATVLSDGEPQSFLSLPVLSCQDMGMPGIPRLKKKSVAKSLLLPTTLILCVPAGMPVLIGGPPTISMSAMIGKAVMKVAGKIAKKALSKLKKFKQGNKFLKDLSAKLRSKVDDFAKKHNLSDAVRDRVKSAICTVTGHPVDVATGKLFTDRVDFELPGPIPFKLERRWFSTSNYSGPVGHGWHHSYDMALHFAENDLIVLRNEEGRYIGFPALASGESYYDKTERLTLRRDAQSRYAVQDDTGLTYEFATTSARVVRHGSDVPVPNEHRLTAIRDRVGNELLFERDARGLLLRITDSAGRVLIVDSDSAGRMQTLQAPSPDRSGTWIPVMEYRYDQKGDLVETRDAHGQAMRYVYENHLLVKETDRANLSFYFTWEGSGITAKCNRTWGDGGIYDHKIAYDDITQVTTVENSLGYKTLYQHDGAVVTRTIDPVGATTVVKYDEHYQKLSETDPNGLTTSYVYDDRANLVEVIGPDGAKTKVAYDSDDKPVEVVDPLGGLWTFKYDDAGRLVERVDALNRRVRLWYAARNLSGVTDPEEHATGFEYDDQQNLDRVTTSNGAVSRVKYDAWGRPIELVDPQGNLQTRSYDLLSNVVRVEEPDGNVRTLAYDAEGRVVHAKDQQHDVEFGYRGMGRLAYRTEAKTTVRFEYDTEEQLIAIQNEHGRVYEFKLDPRGEVETESGFDGIRRLYKRDLGGRVKELTRPNGAVTQYQYDQGSRVTKVVYADGSSDDYAYRIDGELMIAKNASAPVMFERDALGRITKELQGANWVESTYALSGLRAELRSSMGAHQKITRNAMGDVTDVSTVDGSFQAQFKRDLMGLELERTLPGGVRARWKRDKLGRPVEHELSSGKQVLRARSYVWDPNDRLRMVIDAMKGPVQYGHDALGNLAYARYSDGRADLRLPDAVGNLFKREDRRDRTYGPAGQLLSSTGPKGTTRYHYDAEGNLIEKIEPGERVWKYSWDNAGMLAEVTRPDGHKVTFTYDALGRRLKKTYRGKTTRWVWDGNVPLHEWVEVTDKKAAVEAQAATADSNVIAIHTRQVVLSPQPAQAPPLLRAQDGTEKAPITWLFEPESFAPLAKLVGDEQYSIVTDHLGTPLSMVDARGQETWAADIDTYGVLHGVVGERNACPFRWPGQYEDEETGLYYNRFRYYDAESGQYVSQDPIGLAGGLELHGYVEDPLVWADPFGLAKCGLQKRRPATVAKLRKEFGKKGGAREKFLKNLAAKPSSQKNFSAAARKQMQQGKVPKGMIVHHKKPLFRGGDNRNSNLILMSKKDHQVNSRDLHYYPEGENPFGLD